MFAASISFRHALTTFVCCWAFGLVALGADPGARPDARVKPIRRILVGAASDRFPMSYIDEEGNCVGFSVDLLDAVARVMGLQVQRVVAPSGQLHERFNLGELDVLQTYTPTPMRRLGADFSTSQIRLQGHIFVRRDDARLKTLEDLRGKKLGVVGRASMGQTFAKDIGNEENTLVFSSAPVAFGALERGDIDAVFGTRLTMLSLEKQNQVHNVVRLGDPLEGYDVAFCFAVRMGNRDLLDVLDEGLALLHLNGEYDRIYQRWFGREDGPRFTPEEVMRYVAVALGLGLFGTALALLRQRALRRDLARHAERLADSETRLAEAQRLAQLGYWRFEVESRQIFVGEEASRILGVPFTSAPVTRRHIWRRVPVIERSALTKMMMESVQQGAPGETVCSYARSEGSVRVLHVKARPRRDAEGHVVALVGTVQDITEQKATQDTLRAGERLLRTLYDHVPSAMGVVRPEDSSFRFASANRGTSVLLRTPHDVAGKRLDELGLDAAVEQFWATWFRQGFARSELIKTEQFLSGVRRHYAILLVPLEGGQSSGSSLCFLVDDVTERRQIDAEIAQTRKLRAVGEMVGGIAHEFNNLLTPILLKVDLIKAEWPADLRLHAELDAVNNAAQRGAQLTRRLLTFGRRSETGAENINPQALLQSVLELFHTAVDRRISVQVDFPPGLPVVHANPTDLHQILLNLLLNARDTLVEKLARAPSTSWEAKIIIRGRRQNVSPSVEPAPSHPGRIDDWLCLTVEDNGQGMPPEVQERIFEPFFTTKEVGKGTGLGLATVWHLTESMGGRVTVSSRPGAGTAFTLWIPSAAPGSREAASLPTSSHPAGSVAGAGQALRIAVVEDDELVAATMMSALRRDGHHVDHLAHGATACDHLRADRDYDLLVLDLDLPGMSGVELLRRLKESGIALNTIVSSGRMLDRDVEELVALGVEERLNKPFTPQELRAAIDRACSLP